MIAAKYVELYLQLYITIYFSLIFQIMKQKWSLVLLIKCYVMFF